MIPCVFFLKCETGYELHFCTKKRDKGRTTVSWYRWNLGQDFFNILNTYGRLPLEMDVKKLMNNMQQRDVYKQKEQDLKQELKQERQENAKTTQ